MSEQTLAKDLRDIGINDMTPAVWRTMSAEQQQAWYDHWDSHGLGCFVCILCGFPVHFGGAPCAACEPSAFERFSTVAGAQPAGLPEGP